jgi:hypothetical protein
MAEHSSAEGLTMHTELNLKCDYEDLDIQKFSRILDNNAQGYKFFWLQAILQVIMEGKYEASFEDLIDRMLAEAWYTVSTYHLWLGPRYHEDQTSNCIEQAVNALNQVCSLPYDADQADIIAALHAHDDAVKEYKNKLTINVPYRLLSPFVEEYACDWYKPDRMIALFNEVNQKAVLPYTIRPMETRLHSIVQLNMNWALFLKGQYPIVHDWLLYNEVLFLQQRNPGVPGIIQKLEPERKRKLDDVKALWKAVLQNKEIMDIYTDVPVNQERYDIDHFIPWSFVASDELWNLNPADKSSNTSKNNRLPDWSHFSKKFIDQQYALYTQIFQNDQIHQLFHKCRKDNLHNKWAAEMLYIPDHNYDQFASILEKNLKAEYDAAYDQGFGVWVNNLK